MENKTNSKRKTQTIYKLLQKLCILMGKEIPTNESFMQIMGQFLLANKGNICFQPYNLNCGFKGKTIESVLKKTIIYYKREFKNNKRNINQNGR